VLRVAATEVALEVWEAGAAVAAGAVAAPGELVERAHTAADFLRDVPIRYSSTDADDHGAAS